ncbi:hypothetical protein QFZ87_000255 [Bacillus sp. SLBN-46]|nr:hypothetical protein [Bacillus sp. SLBN-46]
MRPKAKEKTTKGSVERFYAPEVKGKNSKRSRTVYLRDHGQIKWHRTVTYKSYTCLK